MSAENEGSGRPAEAEEIHRLLEQRATFQLWLDKLDGVKGKFRPEVATRVERDYRERLGQVEAELGAHRAGIEAALEERRKEAGALSDRRDTQAAELEEVELRHAVGELAEGDWERQRRELEEALAALDRSIEEERGAIGELESIVADLSLRPAERPRGGGRREPQRRREPAPAAAAAGASATPARQSEEVEEEDRTAEERAEEEQGEEEGDDLLDELEFLDSLALEDAGRFDAVTRMLEEKEEEERPD